MLLIPTWQEDRTCIPPGGVRSGPSRSLTGARHEETAAQSLDPIRDEGSDNPGELACFPRRPGESEEGESPALLLGESGPDPPIALDRELLSGEQRVQLSRSLQ